MLVGIASERRRACLLWIEKSRGNLSKELTTLLMLSDAATRTATRSVTPQIYALRHRLIVRD